MAYVSLEQRYRRAKMQQYCGLVLAVVSFVVVIAGWVYDKCLR